MLRDGFGLSLVLSLGLSGVPPAARTVVGIARDRTLNGMAALMVVERLFSAIWGVVLLSECAARLVGAFTLPIATMAWLSTVFFVGAIAVGCIVGGAAAKPIEEMVNAETAA